MRNGFTLSKFACTTRPRSIVIAWPSGAEPVESRALCLILGAAGIDDLAADVADDPDMIELDVARSRDRRLHHLGEITEMAEVEGDAFAGALGKRVAMRPVGNLRHAQKDVAHSPGVEIAQRVGPAGRIDERARLAQQSEAKGHRILA